MRKEDEEGILASVEEGEMGIGYSRGCQRKRKRKEERYMGNIISFYLPKMKGNDTFASEGDKLSTLRVKRELFHDYKLAYMHIVLIGVSRNGTKRLHAVHEFQVKLS
ncbi:hypothetical protein OsI_18784 [Oryza sativa Indica Group]|uniref:Uncharacterized protein n=4 Tax=Oryza TaxID=4527 RepID=Q53WI9_ORYSJ|nr:hypothetical protein [Oryza sativa Japonica Group]AAV59455.1 hypothetical protein [Oryza sativa Japonica Group]EAY96864.1 hypothetical protein OsI_18784 [Oryza sativa Indica Group]EEE62645.1 hypothetical protein OsJ_17448 [Oryza sativa Japonica Group]